MKASSVVLAALFFAACSGAGTLSDAPAQTEETYDWITLFDGTDLDGWRMAGPGSFELQPDGTMLARGGMGLFYYAERPFRDFVLELDFKVESDSTNSGVFLRFPERTDDPWYAVNNGYEVQIYDKGDPAHATGAIYDQSGHFKLASRAPGAWNTYRIEVTGQRYQVYLNGEKVNDFFGDRGRKGFIGVQNHDDHSKVWFRNLRVKPLPPDDYPESLADLMAMDDEREPIRVLVVTTTHGYRHASIETIHELLPSLNATTEFQFDVTEDVADLNPEHLATYDVLFFANSTLRVDGTEGTADAADPVTDENAWRTYDLDLAAAGMTGTAILSGSPDNLSGTIQFQGYPATPMENLTFDGSTLTFSFEGGQYGTIQAEATIDDTDWKGTLTVGGQPMPLTGTIAAGEATTDNTPAAPASPSADGVTEAQRQAIMDFLRAGKGVALAHAGLDAFYEWDEYREMSGGGLFEEHPWTQPVRILIEDPDNPSVSPLGEAFWLRDEIYVLDENPRWNSRVLSSLDMQSVGVEQGPADMGRNDHPISWIRNHNGGRVFVTKLGHFGDVWETPAFLEHVLQGLRMAAGRVEADFSGHRVKEVIAENVWPDDIAIDDRGNVWIAELRGKVHRYDAETGETTLIAEIPTTNPEKIEHGLYGIEVDPNFYDGEPYVYAYYAERETFINTLSRFEYRDGALDLASENVLLRVPTEPQCCHQAGDLEWGPDGTLYLSTGDTGMSETRPTWELTEEEIEAFMDRHQLEDYHWSRLVDSERSAQNLQDLRGKIVRINKDGTIPKDNPFFGEPGVRWEIYAYGLRNPYRFKVDQQTGALYIAVVGPDAAYDYDEYNYAAQGGENFGWPRTLGKLFYNEWTPEMIPDYVPPMWEYTYATGGRSATVGPIYRHDGPGAFPEVFQDKVFLFDWARRWIKWADVAQGTFTSDTENDVRATPPHIEIPARRYVNIKQFDQLTMTAPISMELGPDGAVYVAEFDGFWDAGPNAKVTRYRWISGNEPPIGDASYTPDPDAPLEIRFDGGRSYDPNADTLTFAWNFGDGTTSTERTPVHRYADPGTYRVALTVTDAHGASSRTVTIDVTVGTAGAAEAKPATDTAGGR